MIDALLWIAVATATATGEPALPPPYQVEGVISGFNRYHNDLLGVSSPRVVIDLGAVEGKEFPEYEQFGIMTVIGSAGIGRFHLESIGKICEFLCGDEAEECHYVAYIVPVTGLDDIGTPLVALPGDFELTDFTPPAQHEVAIDDALRERGFARPLWPDEEEEGGTRYRFEPLAGGAVAVETRWGEGDTYRYESSGCRATTWRGLTTVMCEGLEGILADGAPAFVSLPDYNSPAARILASFDHAGASYYLVQLAIKAQTVHGLVVRTDEGWRALIRPRDYALLC